MEDDIVDDDDGESFVDEALMAHPFDDLLAEVMLILAGGEKASAVIDVTATKDVVLDSSRSDAARSSSIVGVEGRRSGIVVVFVETRGEGW